VNNLLVIIEPDVSRSDKLYTALSWDDTGFLVNLRIRRTGLSEKGERRTMILLLFQCNSCPELVLILHPSSSCSWQQSRN
jgi:hypothetical protein